MNKKLVTGGIIGTIISIICCTTPIISIIALIGGLYIGKQPTSKK